MVKSPERVKPRTTTLGANRPSVSVRRAASSVPGTRTGDHPSGMSTVTDGGPGNCSLGYFRVGIGAFRGNLAATGDCTAKARPDGEPDQWGELPHRSLPTSRRAPTQSGQDSHTRA